jgi:hypothetical protein
MKMCGIIANKTLGRTSLYVTSAGNVTKPQEKILSGSVSVICETCQDETAILTTHIKPPFRHDKIQVLTVFRLG